MIDLDDILLFIILLFFYCYCLLDVDCHADDYCRCRQIRR